MRVLQLWMSILLLNSAQASRAPTVFNKNLDVTYTGFEGNGVEVFLGIRFGQDTSGENRFRQPKPYIPKPGTIIDAKTLGHACPQETGRVRAPLALGNITDISEDCLNLNIVRPDTLLSDGARFPVMVWMYGGSFWVGYNGEPTTRGDGLVLESIENGLPVIHVSVNYRLGPFGFAQSGALQAEKSENAGLRDQRLAIEWVRDNIAAFGGDPDNITIHGQSSGGFAVTAQILAYGGTIPAPFQRGICQSQALATGITGTYTRDAMQVLVDYLGCNNTSFDSPETITCLQSFDMQTLYRAAAATYRGDLGDIWLPSIDGDFWPDAPSKLLRDGRFAKVPSVMIGWTEDDLTLYTDTSITTDQDTWNYVRGLQPGFSDGTIDKLLSLYPVSEFRTNLAANKSSEFYRAARISRDILMVCQPMFLAEHLAASDVDVYLYDWNQTVTGPALEAVRGMKGIGIPHTAELGYTFGNISVYDVNGYPFEATKADFALQHKGARSWSTFAVTGQPGVAGKKTFAGWESAYQAAGGGPYIWVAGGPNEGLSAVDGPASTPEIEAQRLRERCAFLNSDEVIEELRY